MKDLNSKGCGFSKDIVPYMYGELASAATAAFESHLLECGKCTDEFAMVSGARYEVYDWKKREFDPLPTPVIRIPYGEVAEPVSWVEKLRTVFSQSWAVPSVAFAGLAIVSVFSLSFYFSAGEDPAVAQNNSNSAVPSMEFPQPTVQPKIDEARAVVKAEPRKETPKIVPVRTTSNRTITPRRAAVRVTTDNTAAPRSLATRAPRLNEFNEVEDMSPRLAQLFEDIDTRRED